MQFSTFVFCVHPPHLATLLFSTTFITMIATLMRGLLIILGLILGAIVLFALLVGGLFGCLFLHTQFQNWKRKQKSKEPLTDAEVDLIRVGGRRHRKRPQSSKRSKRRH